jgi:hypothetical protein
VKETIDNSEKVKELEEQLVLAKEEMKKVLEESK